ncbi:hypothetical protein MJ564_15725 [Escherichia coli]|nr:hypothetical protein MJ564_15725 [Escherichia coli]
MHWNFNGYDANDVGDSNADVLVYYRYDFYIGVMCRRVAWTTAYLMHKAGTAFNFLPLGAIDGMRIGSTLSYLNQAQSQQGTNQMVLLSRNSMMTLIVMSNFLGSFYLNSGSQFIDTSSFPPVGSVAY